VATPRCERPSYHIYLSARIGLLMLRKGNWIDSGSWDRYRISLRTKGRHPAPTTDRASPDFKEMSRMTSAANFLLARDTSGVVNRSVSPTGDIRPAARDLSSLRISA
jgi:hypothetical protein